MLQASIAATGCKIPVSWDEGLKGETEVSDGVSRDPWPDFPRTFLVLVFATALADTGLIWSVFLLPMIR